MIYYSFVKKDSDWLICPCYLVVHDGDFYFVVINLLKLIICCIYMWVLNRSFKTKEEEIC